MGGELSSPGMIDLAVIPGEVAPSLLSVTSALARPPSSLRGRGTCARPWPSHRSAGIMPDMVAGAGAAAGERGRLAQAEAPAAGGGGAGAGHAVAQAMQRLAALGS